MRLHQLREGSLPERSVRDQQEPGREPVLPLGFPTTLARRDVAATCRTTGCLLLPKRSTTSWRMRSADKHQPALTRPTESMYTNHPSEGETVATDTSTTDNRDRSGPAETQSRVIAEIHGFSQPDATPTPWPVALEQIGAADTFWLTTVRPDGRPHVTPLITVWHDDAIWFATGPDERKALNLEHNHSCVLTAGCSDLAEGALDIVLEGLAEQITDDAELQPVAAAYAAKYGTDTWDYTVRDGAFECRPPTRRGAHVRAIVFRVRPVRGLGFRKGDAFSQTTWRLAR
jgi:Pyridoxamine 5'-phosphate oxidase